jgi:hypothetical protein
MPRTFLMACGAVVMLTRLQSLVLLPLILLVASPARAHFVWILPPRASDSPARVIFSDTLQPDPDTYDRVKARLRADRLLCTHDARGDTKPVQLAKGKDGPELDVAGQDICLLTASCSYGVVKRGKDRPFFLKYYAKTGIGDSDRTARLLGQRCDELALDILLVSQSPPTIQVLWDKKPLPAAQVVLLMPGQDKAKTVKTDAGGKVALDKPTEPGLCGIRALHVEDRTGKAGERQFESVRHYSTLTLALGNEGAARQAGDKKEDPEATKLLADARAARALYEHFPGFKADLEINVDGQVEKGEVTVSARGKVTVKLGKEGSDPWVKNTLASTIGHRLDNGPREAPTPCAFVDDVKDHPLGRAIRVLNDEFHSSYRIRDRQVIVVNRQMPDSRFTITVVESHQTPEKKYMPSCFVVNTWDLKTGTLKSAETHSQSWQRVGDFELPQTLLVLKATAGKLESRRMNLSNVRLEK